MEQDVNTWAGVFAGTTGGLWSQLISYLPRLFGALLVLIIGLIVAYLLGKLTYQIVKWLRIDEFFRREGVSEDLRDMGFRFTFANVIGWVVKWFFIIVTFVAVIDILNLPQLNDFLRNVLFYIPNVIVAIIILAVGLVLGRFIQGAISTSLGAARMGKQSSLALGVIAKWAIYIFALMAALVQLKIASSLIQILFTGLVFMLSLAGGLAFGMGGRDSAKKIVDSVDNNMRERGTRAGM